MYFVTDFYLFFIAGSFILYDNYRLNKNIYVALFIYRNILGKQKASLPTTYKEVGYNVIARWLAYYNAAV